MGLLSRRPARPRSRRGLDRQKTAVTAFWDWWAAAGAARAAAAVNDRAPQRVTDDLNRYVERIHPGLGWELGTGSGSRHVLVVTPEGDPELRAAARRWRRAAPEADAVWQYSDARLPCGHLDGLTLEVEGVRIEAASSVVSARIVGTALDVAVHHPAFRRLPERPRTTAAFLLLDQALGEADAETWLGTVEVAQHPPPDPVPLAALPSVVRDLRALNTEPDGSPSWALLRGDGPEGFAVTACAQVPLRPSASPHLDIHVLLQVSFAGRGLGELPGSDELAHLRALEQHIGARLGGSGRIVAHETHPGYRLFHIYLDGATPAVEQIRAAITGWTLGRIRLAERPDPAWSAVAHLSGR